MHTQVNVLHLTMEWSTRNDRFREKIKYFDLEEFSYRILLGFMRRYKLNTLAYKFEAQEIIQNKDTEWCAMVS